MAQTTLVAVGDYLVENVGLEPLFQLPRLECKPLHFVLHCKWVLALTDGTIRDNKTLRVRNISRYDLHHMFFIIYTRWLFALASSCLNTHATWTHLLWWAAGYRTRTDTVLLPRDFKSPVSAIPPIRRMVCLERFELSTTWLKVMCSSIWATGTY